MTTDDKDHAWDDCDAADKLRSSTTLLWFVCYLLLPKLYIYDIVTL